MKNRLSIIAGIIFLITSLFVGCNPNQWAAHERVNSTTLEQGNAVTVQLKTGELLSGTYVGSSSMSSDEYKEYYAATTRSEGSDNVLPSLGQRVKFSTLVSTDKVWEAQLVGFDESAMMVKFDNEQLPQKVYITGLMTLAGKNSEVFRCLQFRQFFLNGEIPLMTTLVVRNELGENVSLPVSAIRGVDIHDGTTVGQESKLNYEQLLTALRIK